MRPPTSHSAKRVGSLREFVRLCDSYDSISLDVFDTLVHRVHRDPELIKPRVAHFVSLLLSSEGIKHEPQRINKLRRQIEWHLCHSRWKSGQDPEATLTEIAEGLFRTHGAENYKELAQKWLSYEHEAENAWIGTTQEVIESLKSLRRSGKKIFFVSDMYLDEHLVRSILANKGLLELADGLYVSGNRQAGKYSGRLFRLLASEHNIDLTRHIHIGDSMRSDVEGPRLVGAMPVWLMGLRPDERVSGAFAQTLKSWLSRRRELAGKSIGYRVGFELIGPSFWGYVSHLLDQAVREGGSTIVFLAREGDLYMRMAEVVWNSTPRYRSFKKPEFRYGLLSRRLCAPSALRALGQFELQLAELRTKPLNLNNIVETFDLESSKVEAFAAPHLLSMHEPLDRWDPRLKNLLDDQGFQSYCRGHGHARRRLLAEYLAGLGVHRDSGTVLFSDAGWSGTIQYLISQSFKGEPALPRIVGVYFGMHWNNLYDFDSGDNIIMPGYFVDSRQDAALANEFQPLKPILEVSATASHGSAISLRRNEHGLVEAVLAPPYESFEDGRADIQAGVWDFTNAFAPTYELYEWPPAEMKAELMQAWRQRMFCPDRQTARALGRLTQSVDWGSIKHVTLVPQGVSVLSWLRPGKLREQIRRSIWPAAAMKMAGVSPRQYHWIARIASRLRRSV